MSGLLGLLAAGAGTPVDPDPPGEAWETALSPTWQNVVRVGPSRTYTTPAAALAAIKADGGTFASTDPSAGNYGGGMFAGTPRAARYRTVMLFDPGTYTLSGTYLDLVGGIDLVGASGDAADVTLVGTGSGGNNYFANVYNDFYTAHVTYQIPDDVDTGKSYATHLTWYSLRHPTTNIFENVVINDLETTRPGGPVGWDGPDNSLIYMKGCELNGSRITVLHGDADASGIQIVYEDCAINLPSVQTFTGATLITQGTMLNGSPVTNSGTIPTITNGSHRPTRYTPAATETTTLYPLASPPGDIGPVALTTGIVYMVPVDITVAGPLSNVSASITTVAGTVALGLYTEATATPDKPADAGGIYTTTPVTATASPTKGLTGIWTKGYLTRDHTVWAAILVTDAAARAQGSTTMSTTLTCYRSTASQSGVAAFPVAVEAIPAGTAVPWLGVTLTA